MNTPKSWDCPWLDTFKLMYSFSQLPQCTVLCAPYLRPIFPHLIPVATMAVLIFVIVLALLKAERASSLQQRMRWCGGPPLSKFSKNVIPFTLFFWCWSLLVCAIPNCFCRKCIPHEVLSNLLFLTLRWWTSQKYCFSINFNSEVTPLCPKASLNGGYMRRKTSKRIRVLKHTCFSHSLLDCKTFRHEKIPFQDRSGMVFSCFKAMVGITEYIFVK